jgi:hypothetical protein
MSHSLVTDDLTDMKLVELNFMKPVKYGKYPSGESLRRVFPRLEYLSNSMTILDIKKFIVEKVKYLFKKQGERFESEEELNKCILIHVVDNLPYERTGSYSSRKAKCEFCE